MAGRANPTETEKRLDRAETAIAQLAAGLKQANGWRPGLHGASAVAEIVGEAAGGGIERRPYTSPEQREAA
jgi:plasmid stabilization system protein ParE